MESGEDDNALERMLVVDSSIFIATPSVYPVLPVWQAIQWDYAHRNTPSLLASGDSSDSGIVPSPWWSGRSSLHRRAFAR
jgi:hypothetical protein